MEITNWMKNEISKEDKELLEYYKKGFEDELDGKDLSSEIEKKGTLHLSAYRLGALHALYGDDVRSLDYLSDNEILNLIKKNKK